jgi:hypothetical protein
MIYFYLGHSPDPSGYVYDLSFDWVTDDNNVSNVSPAAKTPQNYDSTSGHVVIPAGYTGAYIKIHSENFYQPLLIPFIFRNCIYNGQPVSCAGIVSGN